MTDFTGESLPSRRQLREAAGSETPPVLTRRELRERDEQSRALQETPHPDYSAEPTPSTVAWQRVEIPTVSGQVAEQPPAPPTYSPPPPPASLLPPLPPLTAEQLVAPLSRRERRALEQVQTDGVATVGEATVGEASPPRVEGALPKMPWEQEAPTPPLTPSATAVAPLLPPVFSSPPAHDVTREPSRDHAADADVMTASSRTVGAGPLPTHALILPTAPSLDVSGPLGTTGEILVTGQIPLPQVMAETGLQGAIDGDGDSSETFDRLIGAESTFTSPMRAVQAISSRGEGKEFEIVRKPRWSVGAIILGVSALLLVVAAGALIAVALLTDSIELPFL